MDFKAIYIHFIMCSKIWKCPKILNLDTHSGTWGDASVCLLVRLGLILLNLSIIYHGIFECHPH